MTKQYYVYILTNRTRRLYVGVTNDLLRRMFEHKQRLVPGFTSTYNLTWLAYYETANDIYNAIGQREGDQGVAAREETGAGGDD